MARYFALTFALVLLAGAACRRDAVTAAARPVCLPGLVANWSSDSSISICLPPGFDPESGSAGAAPHWARIGFEYGQISISIDTTDVPNPQWPPHLTLPAICAAVCGSVDSVSRSRDTLATGVASIESGLWTGGSPAARREALFVAGWKLPTGARVWSYGSATTAPMRDTLRRALRTVQFRKFEVMDRDQLPNDR